MKRIAVAGPDLIDGRQTYVEPDERGESETFEAYSLVCRDGEHLVWSEGIRKDRTNMLPEWRAIIEIALASLKGARNESC